MAEIHRNRTIRPSSRLETSKSYKINTEGVSSGDILVVNIDHESQSFKKTYRFKGADIANRNSISFRVTDYGTHIDISWTGASPLNNSESNTQTSPLKIKPKSPTQSVESIARHSKKSFPALASEDIEILILGTMPGDLSLSKGEYYAHPRNKFWKIISEIINEDLPVLYEEKKEFLKQHKIGLWDVAASANRKGSLDTDILEVIPNDLDNFIRSHQKLRVICFNGAKAMKLYFQFFTKISGIKYCELPSTSPANTGRSFQDICNEWKTIL